MILATLCLISIVGYHQQQENIDLKQAPDKT